MFELLAFLVPSRRATSFLSLGLFSSPQRNPLGGARSGVGRPLLLPILVITGIVILLSLASDFNLVARSTQLEIAKTGLQPASTSSVDKVTGSIRTPTGKSAQGPSTPTPPASPTALAPSHNVAVPTQSRGLSVAGAVPRPASGTSLDCLHKSCYSACIQVNGLSIHSWSASAVAIQWIDYSILHGTLGSDSFQYGLNQNSLNLSSTPSGHFVNLSGLALNKVYYFQIQATATCGGTTFWSGEANCVFTLTSGVQLCPAGTMSIVGVSEHTNPAGTQATFHWSVSPTSLNPPGNTATVSLSVNGLVYGSISSPFTVSGLTPFTPYGYYLQAAAPGYANTNYSGAFDTGCAQTQITGSVFLNQSTTVGVYGADVFDNGVYVAKTHSDGSYLIPLACSAASYSITVRAIGFDTSNVAAVTGSAPANLITTAAPISIPYWSTGQPTSIFWNQNNASFASHTYGSWLGSVSATVTNQSSSLTGGDPSGDPYVTEFSGTDSTSTGNPALAMFDLGVAADHYTSTPLGLSLSAPLYLSFNVYVDPASVSTNFAVDALMTSPAGAPSTTLDSIHDTEGNLVFTSLRTNCNAGAMNPPRGQWTTVYCDLTEVRTLDIQKILLVYHNPSAPSGGGTIRAFFDAISLQEPTYAKAFANGGFELAKQPFGWQYLGYSYISLVNSTTGKVEDGRQALMLGSHSAAPSEGALSQVYQTVRFMNDLSGYPLTLSLGYYATIAAGGSVDAEFFDHQTSQWTYLIALGSGSTTRWTTATTNVTSLEGHVVTFYLTVHSAASAITYTYFDDVQLLTKSETLNESGTVGSGTNTAILDLPRSTYDPTCHTASPVTDLQTGVSSTNSHWATYLNGQTAEPIENNVSLNVDVWSYTHECSGANENHLTLGVTAAANATGVPRPSNPGGFVGIEDSCVTETFTQSGDVVSPPGSFGLKGTSNMGGSGYPTYVASDPVAQEDSALGTAFDISIEVAAGIVEAANPEIIVLVVAVEIAEALIAYLANGGSGLAQPCTNASQPFEQFGTSFDINGNPATQDSALMELDVDVGSSVNGQGHGGTYTVTLTFTTQYCSIVSYQQCPNLFDTISTSISLEIVTT